MSKNAKGFTLVEIMIVVAIIAILMSVAAPALLNNVRKSKTQACVSNLQQIDYAKEQYILENNGTVPVALTDIVPRYIKQTPICKAGGAYMINAVNVNPSCTYGGDHHL